MPKPFVIYAGRKFHLQSSGFYYQDGSRDHPERLLHRRMWYDARGPIPPDHEIHHKNGDWTDTRIKNLAMVPSSKHRAFHAKKRLRDPKYLKTRLAQLEVARGLAPAWHRSKEGHEWHKKHGQASWKKRKPMDKKCSVCGKPFTAFWERAKFCGRKCRYEDFYARHKLARKAAQRYAEARP